VVACIPEMIEKVYRHFTTFANVAIRLLAKESKVVKTFFIYLDFNNENQKVYFCYDNAPSHTYTALYEILAKKQACVIDYPPDLFPYD